MLLEDLKKMCSLLQIFLKCIYLFIYLVPGWNEATMSMRVICKLLFPVYLWLCRDGKQGSQHAPTATRSLIDTTLCTQTKITSLTAKQLLTDFRKLGRVQSQDKVLSKHKGAKMGLLLIMWETAGYNRLDVGEWFTALNSSVTPKDQHIDSSSLKSHQLSMKASV